MIKFILGAMFGGVVGVCAMAALISASDTDDRWGWNDRKE